MIRCKHKVCFNWQHTLTVVTCLQNRPLVAGVFATSSRQCKRSLRLKPRSWRSNYQFSFATFFSILFRSNPIKISDSHRLNRIKLFFIVVDAAAKKARPFIRDKLFHISLLFVRKSVAYQSGTPFNIAMFPDLYTNSRLTRKK